MEKNSRKYKTAAAKAVKRAIPDGKKKLVKGVSKGKLNLTTIIALAVVILIGFGLYFICTYGKNDEKTPLPVEGELFVEFIDVGQGDSTLIYSEDAAMLIDSGESSATQTVIERMKELGIEKLDVLVATHPHSDHMGGMYKLIDKFEISEVIIPHMADEDIPTTRFFEKFLDACDSNDVSVSEAEIGRTIKLGDASAEITAPQSEEYDNLNNYSIGIYLTHGENTFLLTGDAEKKAEKDMLSSGKIRHADVFKAGHHGSSSSSSAEFLKAVSPEYAVISCGAGNSYGHPNKETLEALSKYTDKIYRTDISGSIIFTSDGDELKVSTER